MQLYTVYFIWKLLYMFREVPPPIFKSANNCIYSICYLSHRYCYLPLSWKSWNWFECAVLCCKIVRAMLGTYEYIYFCIEAIHAQIFITMYGKRLWFCDEFTLLYHEKSMLWNSAGLSTRHVLSCSDLPRDSIPTEFRSIWLTGLRLYLLHILIVGFRLICYETKRRDVP
jgi:hypothetical protein